MYSPEVEPFSIGGKPASALFRDGVVIPDSFALPTWAAQEARLPIKCLFVNPEKGNEWLDRSRIPSRKLLVS